MGRRCGKKPWEYHKNTSKGQKKLIDSTILGWPQQHGHTPAKMFHSDVQNCFCELRGLSCWPSLCFVESLNHPEKDDAVQLLRRCRASKDPLKTRHLALVPETASLGNLYQQLSGAKMGLATSKGRIETYIKHYTNININIIHLTSRMSICIVSSKHGILYIYMVLYICWICWHLAAYSPLRVLALWPLSIEDLFGWRV